ncbi:MAG: DUF6580 family putative transport protein [Bacteroidota bacterium]
MENKFLSPRLILIVIAILTGAFMRLVPHWPNFTPIAAIALFGGAYINRKDLAILIPLMALFLSDLFLGLHAYLIPVYGCFAITAAIGFFLKNKISGTNVILASLASSLLFFLVTNFAVWALGMNFSRDFSGLMQCYTIALPFFLNGTLGDLFYTGVLFGGFALAQQRYPALQRIK